MNLSAPAIARPVATLLLTIGLFLAGALAFLQLPVAPLPQVDFPVITVTARVAGASAETMAATVATPLEQALGTISGVNEITSTSSLGSTNVVLQFDLSRDIDSAARDVQAAINAAMPNLPTSLSSRPTYRKVNPADQPIMMLSITSDRAGRAEMYDAADTLLQQRIMQVAGVGDVTITGGAAPAVRVQVNFPALDRAGISLETVRAAIAAASIHGPLGMVDAGDHSWIIATNDQLLTPDEYGRTVIQWSNGMAVRLRDVATITNAQQSRYNIALTNGHPAVQMQVYRQPGANIIETVAAVTDLLPRLEATLPPGMKVQVALERTTSIRASLTEIERSLLLSVVLVMLVVFVFLRDVRAMIVPAIAVPVSLVATFAIMYLFGFSLDNLSLMALTIATGFVVDDAVVVLENTMRHVEAGMPPRQAALQGAREVGFTILSMSLSLVAVFIPILAMGGIVGRYFHEFSIVIASAILISMVVSLTTTPMLCALLLRQRTGGETTAPSLGSRLRGFGDAFIHRLESAYETSLIMTLRHRFTMLVVFVATIAATVMLYMVIPKGFFPQQDIGILQGGIQADQSISFDAMSTKLQQFVGIVQADPAVKNVMAFTGGRRASGASMTIVLKPLTERGVSAQAVADRLRPQLARVPGARLFLTPASDIRVGARMSDAGYQYTLQADDLATLEHWAPVVRLAFANIPQLTDVNTDSRDRGGEIMLDIDRDTMTRLGLTVKQVDTALNNTFGERQIAHIYRELNQYTVVMEASASYLRDASSLSHVSVINAAGNIIPLSAIATWKPTVAPLQVSHQSGQASTTISFNLADGASIGTATEAINQAMDRAGVPTSVHGSFQGNASAFQDSLASQPFLILAAIITIYIVLGILYESAIHPVTILSTIPSAGLGALVALILADTEFSVIALIGVILLVGLVKKNAIMMIDFAITAERDEGMAPEEAIRRAAVLRLRPILMTTLAAIFGALPLALGHGDGAELRQPLGIAIVGGLLVSQWITLYTTPAIYLWMDRLRGRRPVVSLSEKGIS